jgi:succinate dehydrogenase / fumarate reductase, iron-sulfur subunit
MSGASDSEQLSVTLRIRRQDAADRPDTRRWEEHSVVGSPDITLAGALRSLERTIPVAFDYECLQGECGACTMLVDGHVRQACTTRLAAIAKKSRRIVLEPLSKFPVIRDLIVDRSGLVQHSERVRGWLDLDATQGDGPLRVSADDQRVALALARCSECAACLEACPQYGPSTDFVGAAALNDVRRLALHPIGRLQRRTRLEAVMTPGGVADCGKAQNCVEVCPMEIPLVDSIQMLSRETSKHLIWGWLLG